MEHRTLTSHRPRAGARYRHEALFYAGLPGFVAGTAPFIQQGVEAGEPVMVVVSPTKIDALRTALGPSAGGVSFADMDEAGRNPACLIPLWQEFVTSSGAGDRSLRGIGEPIWATRSRAEIDECERHEALLNVSFGDVPFSLMCPYDTAGLAESILTEARRNHPFVTERGQSAPSGSYPGADRIPVASDRPLAMPPSRRVMMHFDGANLPEVRRFVHGFARATSELSGDRIGDLVIAVNEITTNSVVHGGGRGTLVAWAEGGSFLCEVCDLGRIDDPLAGRVRPPLSGEGGRGLWLANHLCDLVQVRGGAGGTCVRLHVANR